jgi:hypothetical protein
VPKSDEAKALETIAKHLGDLLTEIRSLRRDLQRTPAGR